MAQSALVGQSPVTEDDKLIHKALQIISPSTINPNPLHPFGIPAPEDAPFESRASGMIIGTSIAIALVILITTARLIVRKFYLRSFRADDWVIIPAAMACITYLSLQIVTETKGCLGKHIYQCSYEELSWFMTMVQSQEPIFYFCVFTVKASIALQSQRITGMDSHAWRFAHWTYLTIVLLLLPITVFLNLFQCTPISSTYSLKSIGLLSDPSSIQCLGKTTGRMSSRLAVKISTRSLHAATDVALLFIPIIIIYKLQIKWSKKLRIGAVFAIGLVSFFATIMRNLKLLRRSEDPTWENMDTYAWDVVDVLFATVVASLPSLNCLIDRVISQFTHGSRFNSSEDVKFLAPWEEKSTPRGIKRVSSKSVSTMASNSTITTKFSRTDEELKEDLRMLGRIHRKIHVYESWAAGMEGYQGVSRDEELGLVNG